MWLFLGPGAWRASRHRSGVYRPAPQTFLGALAVFPPRGREPRLSPEPATFHQIALSNTRVP